MEFDLLMKGIGALGLVLIIGGMLNKQRKNELYFFIAGGIALTAYSMYIQDLVFIALQVIYTIVAVYELIKLKK